MVLKALVLQKTVAPQEIMPGNLLVQLENWENLESMQLEILENLQATIFMHPSCLHP